MIKLGSRAFNPPWWATGLFVLTAAAMLLLGRWQLQRAAEKISLATAAEQALSADPVDLLELLSVQAGKSIAVVSANALAEAGDQGVSAPTEASSDYQRVTLTGTLLTEQQFLWDNRVHKGQAGFEVITPMRVNGGDTVVLLNRGWIPPGQSRDQLPDVSLAGNLNTEGVATEVVVKGLLTEPSRGFSSGPALEASKMAGADSVEVAQPKLLQYFDYHAISESLGEPVVAGLIQRIEQIEYVAVAKDTDQEIPGSGKFLKIDNWQPVANGPEKHYGYAFQWFGMLIALTVIYWLTNSRKIKPEVVTAAD